MPTYIRTHFIHIWQVFGLKPEVLQLAFVIGNTTNIAQCEYIFAVSGSACECPVHREIFSNFDIEDIRFLINLRSSHWTAPKGHQRDFLIHWSLFCKFSFQSLNHSSHRNRGNEARKGREENIK